MDKTRFQGLSAKNLKEKGLWVMKLRTKVKLNHKHEGQKAKLELRDSGLDFIKDQGLKQKKKKTIL